MAVKFIVSRRKYFGCPVASTTRRPQRHDESPTSMRYAFGEAPPCAADTAPSSEGRTSPGATGAKNHATADVSFSGLARVSFSMPFGKAGADWANPEAGWGGALALPHQPAAVGSLVTHIPTE